VGLRQADPTSLSFCFKWGGVHATILIRFQLPVDNLCKSAPEERNAGFGRALMRSRRKPEGAKSEMLADGVNPKFIAARLTRARWSDTRGGFNRKLVYEPWGLA
jgi:hypothetical protein